jgi:hypothetical protein
MNDRPVRVAALRVSNILGITTAEIRPGLVTLIEGANGLGKTSILESFRAVLSGGHDCTLLRNGSDKGEICLLLDDGTEIRKTVTAEKSSTKVISPEFGQVSKPATFLDRLRDAFALNPVDFLLCKKDARLQLLLAAIPLKLNPRDLAGITGLCSTKPNFDQHAMITLSAIAKDLYDQRTGVNRVAKEKRTTANEMAKALPPEAAGEGSPMEALQSARQGHQQFRLLYDSHAKAIDGDAAKKKDELRAEASTRIEEIRAKLQKDIEDVDGAAKVSHEMLAEERSQKEPTYLKAIADLEASAATHARTETTRKHLGELNQSADKFEETSKQLTEALGELDQIRAALLDELPIKGLTVDNGDIYIDGVPFDRLNESRRVRLAIDVAMLRAGSLPLLCCDGLESLDSASLIALENAAAEMNIQLVLARVTDGPLSVVNVK